MDRRCGLKIKVYWLHNSKPQYFVIFYSVYGFGHLTEITIKVTLTGKFAPGEMMLTNFDSEKYSPKFSGHETFPLRFGWLKKAYDAVEASNAQGEKQNPFRDEAAIAKFGVGKNMVASMQHWAEVTGFIAKNLEPAEDDKRVIINTPLADAVLNTEGHDPYLENPATSWIVHWNLVSKPTCTTWYWSFNHFNYGIFDREQLQSALASVCAERGWSKRASLPTLKRDVECFVRTYSAKPLKAGEGLDASIDGPLVELGLLDATGKRDGFRFNFGEKPNLSDECFAYIIFDYWEQHIGAQTNSVSLEALALNPSSPGRCLLLDIDSLTRRLERLEQVTQGKLWLDPSAGLKELRKRITISDVEKVQMLKSIYKTQSVSEHTNAA